MPAGCILWAQWSVSAGYGLPLACATVLQLMLVSCHFRGCTVPLQKFVCDSVTLIAVLHFIFHFILQVYNTGESDSPWLYVCVTHLTLHLLISLSAVFGPYGQYPLVNTHQFGHIFRLFILHIYLSGDSLYNNIF